MNDWMSISEACRRVPTSNGKRLGTASMWRWCTKGLNGVKLRHGRAGRRIVIAQEDLDAFFRELAEVTPHERAQAPTRAERTRTRTRTPEQLEQAAKAAEMRMQAKGVL